ncbi:MAG: GNAT family N-acetyltransferase [Chloroflexi bacterium]|nr:GNAT family N-acetyltransferase [Chloroflexota bacterium]
MIKGNKVILREKKLSDALDDYTWETDEELAYLDAVPPTSVTFSQFLLGYTSDLRDPVPTSRRLAVDTLEGKHIGNCSYYNINDSKQEAELGIMIGNRDYWDKGYGADAVATLLKYIFSETNTKRVYLKTLESNKRAQNCFVKSGFAPYGQMTRNGYSFILMEIERKEWEERQKLSVPSHQKPAAQ